MGLNDDLMGINGFEWDIPSGNQTWLENLLFGSMMFPISMPIYSIL